VSPEAIGAFFSGVGAVISSIWALRRMRKRSDADCQQRIDEILAALREGVDIGEHKPE